MLENLFHFTTTPRVHITTGFSFHFQKAVTVKFSSENSVSTGSNFGTRLAIGTAHNEFLKTVIGNIVVAVKPYSRCCAEPLPFDLATHGWDH